MEQLLKQAATAGLAVKKISLAATASEAEISATLQRLSEDPDVAGIILQSPLPSGVYRARVVTAIDPQKDVDGATATNAARLTSGDLDGTLLPATAAAVMELLRAHEIPLRDQRAVVVGRSAVVGGPVAQLLALAGAQVAVVHSKTPDISRVRRRSWWWRRVCAALFAVSTLHQAVWSLTLGFMPMATTLWATLMLRV